MKIPTQLWIGHEKQLEEAADLFLAQTFCPYKSSGKGCACPSCINIYKRQHSQIMWLTPQRAHYVLDDIEIVFSITRLQLEQQEQFFIVFKRAHLLGTTCSNKLLKLLEEPPHGYHFLLLSNNLHALPATIKSRAFIKELSFSTQEINHKLLFFFMNDNFRPVEFEATLKETSPNETESKDLLNELLRIYITKFRTKITNASSDDTEELTLILGIQTYLTQALQKPPQPGSAAIFWKNIYLSFPR